MVGGSFTNTAIKNCTQKLQTQYRSLTTIIYRVIFRLIINISHSRHYLIVWVGLKEAADSLVMSVLLRWIECTQHVTLFDMDVMWWIVTAEGE